MTAVTIEPIDLADYDWTPPCDVIPVTMGVRGEPCGKPAQFVIEVRHCTPYRLFACADPAHWQVPGGWLCRVCGQCCPTPVVIGKAS